MPVDGGCSPWITQNKHLLQRHHPQSQPTGICATREQHFRQGYDSPTRFNLHPFGESCFVVLQKSARFNSVTDTAERAIYMFNGQYNLFSHLFADAPQAHVLLRSRNRLQITGRGVFPYTKPSSDGTADPRRVIPG